MKDRILFLDILRILACLMVIVMHSPMPEEGTNGMLLSSISYLTAPCIGLFFMVSGALLLPISEKENTFRFLKKRIGRVLIPTLFWTFFYMTIYSGYSLVSILSIPFSVQGHRFLWFMYTLIGLYLVSPILSGWLRHTTEKEVRFYLYLWGISLCYPLLEPFLYINPSMTGTLYYLSGYAGYFLLGYYLKTYGDRLHFKYVLFLFACSVCIPVFIKVKGYDIDFYRLFWYVSIFVSLMCLFWWVLVQKCTERVTLSSGIQKYVVLLSNLTLGVYLSHLFLMRDVLWKIDGIASIGSYALQTLVVIILTFVLSFTFSWLISFIPKSQYIIGYHRKK